MNCESAAALVEKERDRKLGLAERIGLWIHMGYCRLCRLFYKQSNILDDSAKAYADKVSKEEKSYKLKPESKAKINHAFDVELKNQNV